MAVASDKFKLLRGNKNLTVQILIDMRDELNTSLDRAESYKNFRYLVMLGRALCREYSYRYGKKHKCEDVINQAAHIGSWVVPSCVKTAPPSHIHSVCLISIRVLTQSKHIVTTIKVRSPTYLIGLNVKLLKYFNNENSINKRREV